MKEQNPQERIDQLQKDLENPIKALVLSRSEHLELKVTAIIQYLNEVYEEKEK